MEERLERQFGWLCACCVYLDLLSDPQHHVRSWMWWCVPSVQHWGGRDRRIPGAAGQVVLLNWYASEPVRATPKKVKSNQERHSTLASDFYTHSDKCTWHHAYTYACIYHATHAYKIKIKEKTGRVCKRERECEHTDISGLTDFKACTPMTVEAWQVQNLKSSENQQQMCLLAVSLALGMSVFPRKSSINWVRIIHIIEDNLCLSESTISLLTSSKT